MQEKFLLEHRKSLVSAYADLQYGKAYYYLWVNDRNNNYYKISKK